jgi:hypothetical protein
MNRERTVRISAFPAHWLVETNSYGNSKKITWSTGKRIRPGDIQIFATSATLGDAPELADDPRRDSVHSIWEAATPPKAKYGNRYWPIQAKFKLLIKLRRPVPKRLLHRAGILNVYSWPRSSAGKILHEEKDVKKLANVLARQNPKQRKGIFDALNV